MIDCLIEPLARAGAGDSHAIEEILGHGSLVLQGYLRKQMGPAVRGQLDPLDLAQSICLTLLQDFRGGRIRARTTGEFHALLKRMARRRIHREFHVVLLHDELLKKSVGRCCLIQRTAMDDPRDSASSKELLALVLAELNETDRAIIEAKLEGRDTTEIARELGIEPETVRVRLHRLRYRLRWLHDKFRP